MYGYDCRNKRVFSIPRNVLSDGADWTSIGRPFLSRGPAAAKERSPIVTRLDGRTYREEVDERSRPRRLVGRSATYSRLNSECNNQKSKQCKPDAVYVRVSESKNLLLFCVRLILQFYGQIIKENGP